MLKNLSYKSKSKILLISLILLGWASYSFAIKETIDLYQIAESADVADYSKLTKELALVEKELSELNESVGGANRSENIRQELFALINRLCNSHTLTISDIPQTIVIPQHGYLLETNIFSIKGKFTDILYLIHHIEQKEPISHIASVKFALKRDNKTKRKDLVATITLQNLSQFK